MATPNVPKKNKRSNPNQIKYLVDYMSTHTLFALGEFTGPLGRRAYSEEWERLQGALKEIGPDKSVEQWKNTWRDLKKKARSDGARHNQAINTTGNRPDVPPVPPTSQKILGIIGTESAFGIGQSQETGLGEFPAVIVVPPHLSPPHLSPCPPSHHSPLYLSPCPPSHHSPPYLSPQPHTSAPPPYLSPQPHTSAPPTVTPEPSQNPRRRLTKNDFLASDESTRSVLKEINNNLKERNNLEKIKMRRQLKERLRKYREDVRKHLGN